MRPESIRVSVPEGFIEEMRLEPGIDADALVDALDREPSTGVRLNSRKNNASLFEDAECVKWCATGRYLESRPVFTLMPELHAGAFYVQDPSSMIHREIVARLADSPCVLVDFCAAPGGKTTAAIDALPDGSVVIANEYEPSRVGALKENLIKWGYPGVAVVNAPTSELRSLAGTVDIALVDAPCSGEGMMRKEPDARSQWSKGLIAGCAALQREIVADAAETLRPGGYLVYSTCTFNRTENEETVERMARELGAQGVEVAALERPEIAHGIGTSLPCYRFLPGRVRGEGLFLCVLRKPGGAPAAPLRQAGRTRPDAASAEVAKWLEGDLLLRTGRDGSVSATGRTQAALAPEAAGIVMAVCKGRDIIPAQGLALTTSLRGDAFPTASVDYGTALAYLRREAVALPEGTPRGFVLLQYGGRPLGFVKNLGNRANNLYPQAWRIMSSHTPEEPPRVMA